MRFLNSLYLAEGVSFWWLTDVDSDYSSLYIRLYASLTVLPSYGAVGELGVRLFFFFNLLSFAQLNTLIYPYSPNLLLILIVTSAPPSLPHSSSGPVDSPSPHLLLRL